MDSSIRERGAGEEEHSIGSEEAVIDLFASDEAIVSEEQDEALDLFKEEPEEEALDLFGEEQEEEEETLDLFKDEQEEEEETLDLFKDESDNEVTLDLFSSPSDTGSSSKDEVLSLFVEDENLYTNKLNDLVNLDDLEEDDYFNEDEIDEEISLFPTEETSISLVSQKNKKLSVAKKKEILESSVAFFVKNQLDSKSSLVAEVDTSLYLKINKAVEADRSSIQVIVELEEFFNKIQSVRNDSDPSKATNNALYVNDKLINSSCDTLEHSKQILATDRLGLYSEEYNSPLICSEFHAIRLKMIDKLISSQNSSTRLESINKTSQKEFFLELFSDQKSFLVDQIREDDNVLVFSSVILSPNRAEKSKFICSSELCGEENVIEEDIISYVKIVSSSSAGDKISVCPSVFRCSSCGTVHVLPSKGAEVLTRNCRTIINQIPIENSTEFGCFTRYVPGADEFIDAMGDVFTLGSYVDEKELVFDFDWESLCIDFYRLDDFYYQTKSQNTENGVGSKGVAKMLSNLSTGYSDLKEKSLATLLNVLDNSSLEFLTHSYTMSLITPYAYNDRKDEFIDSIDKVFSDSDKGNSNLSYLSYCKEVESYPNKRKETILHLNNHKYLLANIAIKNFRLTDDLVTNYLMDPKLYEILDEISDLIITSNLSEKFIKSFMPRKSTGKGTVNSKNTSFTSKVKGLTNDNSKKDSKEKVSSFLEYFTGKGGIYDVNSSLDVGFFITSIVQDEDFFSLVSKMSNSILVNDYYDATLCKKELIDRFGLEISAMSMNGFFRPVSTFIYNMPELDVEGKTKFEFYFPYLKNLSKDDQFKILNIFGKTKIVPKLLEGDNVNDLMSFYQKIDINDKPDLMDFKEMDEFVDANRVLCLALCYYRSDIDPENITLFNTIRDLFFSVSSFDFDRLCDAIHLNKDISKLALCEEFELPECLYELRNDIKYLFFKNNSIMEIVQDDNLSLLEKRYSLNSYAEDLLNDSDGFHLSDDLISSIGISIEGNNLQKAIVTDFLATELMDDLSEDEELKLSSEFQ